MGVEVTPWLHAVAAYDRLWRVNCKLGVVDDVAWNYYTARREAGVYAPLSGTPTLRDIVTNTVPLRKGIENILIFDTSWWIWFHQDNLECYLKSHEEAFARVLAERDEQAALWLKIRCQDALTC